MPTFVHTDKCDGCKGGEVTACMYICPHDLMKLDTERMKAFNQEPDQCWECMCCVKACPRQAPVRTTPVGSIDPYKDKPPAGDINSQLLFTEANKQLPTI
jgi:adenylylsulfate reductase subunit B